jgi:hypothetical protein
MYNQKIDTPGSPGVRPGIERLRNFIKHLVCIFQITYLILNILKEKTKLFVDFQLLEIMVVHGDKCYL